MRRTAVLVLLWLALSRTLHVTGDTVEHSEFPECHTQHECDSVLQQEMRLLQHASRPLPSIDVGHPALANGDWQGTANKAQIGTHDAGDVT